MVENFQGEYQQDESIKDNENIQAPHPSPLGKGQKIAAIFLGIFAIFVLVFWGVQFKKSIMEPLSYKGENTEENSSYQEDTDEELKSKDTDKDGLNDWEEMNIYLTSPYLEDSDSDGYGDKEEIDNNNDPNCPVGRDCYGSSVSELEKDTVSEDSDDITQEVLDYLNNSPNVSGDNTGSLDQTSTQELEDLLSGNSSVEDVRKILLEYGISKEQLDKISDEDLINSYIQILGGG